MQVSHVRYVASALAVLAARGLFATATVAQEIPRDQYFRYIPFETPRVVGQTEASARLHLYGDFSSPTYTDVAPVDGIDDARGRIFTALSVRFAPFLVMNSTAIPMDFRLFAAGKESYPLNVDTWNNDVPGGTLIDELSINLLAVADDPCTDLERLTGTGRSADCLLLGVIEEFDPDRPVDAWQRVSARAPGQNLHKVLWIDFPGRSPSDWRREYVDPTTGRLPVRYHHFLKTFVHPFIVEVGGAGGTSGYEIILQYWFFYPFNDGGNDHMGDWEHINVAISPLGALERPLTAEEVAAILNGDGLGVDSGPSQLVIKRIEYYFHSNVMEFDFSSPNAYLPRAEWEAQVQGRIKERQDEDWFWKQIRYRAFEDTDETRINTHPIGYIGADNKGLDQLLSPPGGKNRDSHGTFPLTALYKDVGPAGAAETIGLSFDHKQFFAASAEGRGKWLDKWKRGGVVWLASPEAVQIVPDYERVYALVWSDARVRQEWSWLMLPLRFGYPALVSPFAGVVAHAETGNIAVVGPSFNSGWNRPGETQGYRWYAPHKVPRLFPLAWQDGFMNSWGWLNITLPTLIMFPPIDFLWRIVAAPIRALIGIDDPTFYPSDQVPFRFFGLTGGYSHMNLPDDYIDLLFNGDQFREIIGSLVTYIVVNGSENTVAVGEGEFVDDPNAFFLQGSFYVGDRFVTTGMIRHSRSDLGLSLEFNDIPEPWTLEGELNFWEYSGTFRYDVTGGDIRLFPQAGYGLSWYRIENVTTVVGPLDPSDSPWVRQPSIFPFENLLPNTWHAGLGAEWIVLKSYATPPKGIDASILVEWTYYTNNLGLDVSGLDLPLLVMLGRTAADLPRDRWVGRNEWKLGLTLSF